MHSRIHIVIICITQYIKEVYNRCHAREQSILIEISIRVYVLPYGKKSIGKTTIAITDTRKYMPIRYKIYYRAYSEIL